MSSDSNDLLSQPKVCLCVVTYNSGPLIRGLVESIPSGAAGTNWRLVFADNASTDRTLAEIARWAPDATVVQVGSNLGYAAGINHAIVAGGDSDAFLVLNADVRLKAGCVSTLYNSLSPSIGIVVPRLDDAQGKLIWSMRREPTVIRAWADALIGAERAGRWGLLGEVITDPRLYLAPCPTDWAEGSTQLVSSACWRATGRWDETFFLYSEEAEYDLRARESGFLTLFQPAARAVHLEGGSAESPSQWSLLTINRIRLFHRRHGIMSTFLFWAAALSREGSRALMGKTTSRAAVRDLLSLRRMRERPSARWLAGVHTD